MKLIALLVLIVAFWGNAAASALPSPHHCCQDEQCGMIECIAMGCLSAPAVFVATKFALPALEIQPAALAEPVRVALPLTFREVWTPPD